jgi:sarcosine oxidase subunit delta
MLLIRCPWCGPRPESDFSYGGEAHIARPAQPDAIDDTAWGDYLFFRKNPKGAHREQWCHVAGCRRWFNAERDTVTYTIARTYKPGEKP